MAQTCGKIFHAVPREWSPQHLKLINHFLIVKDSSPKNLAPNSKTMTRTKLKNASFQLRSIRKLSKVILLASDLHQLTFYLTDILTFCLTFYLAFWHILWVASDKAGSWKGHGAETGDVGRSEQSWHKIWKPSPSREGKASSRPVCFFIASMLFVFLFFLMFFPSFRNVCVCLPNFHQSPYVFQMVFPWFQ